MADQKIENLLSVSLQATNEERENSLGLETGYDSATRRWELIVLYTGNEEELLSLRAKYDQIELIPLLNRYAIVTIPANQIEQFAAEPMITYIEKPKRLYFELQQGKSVSCISAVQQGEMNQFGLFGAGTLVGITDTGIDYADREFRNADGSTRILAIWDQTASRGQQTAQQEAQRELQQESQQAGSVPEQYGFGVEYTREEIDRALAEPNLAAQQRIVPERDTNRHGTNVAKIAAGNSGVAPQSELLIVKMGLAGEDSFPRTTQLMTAVDYLVRKALAVGKPVAVNISFGNNYGSHQGTSLVETFLDEISAFWKNVICVGTGNEGTAATHVSGLLQGNAVQAVEMAISPYERSINLQIWKYYWEDVRVELETPSGTILQIPQESDRVSRQRYAETEIMSFFGEPGPYSMQQEIYIDFIPRNTYIDSGIWIIRITPDANASGTFQMWLPSQAALNEGTGFLYPSPNLTITIPATASQIIAVGAYNAYNFSYAPFSGRGYDIYENGIAVVQPTLVAPGVNVRVGSTQVSGTSFATPFVTGAAALLMEWGIVRGNDAFLYGEKVKAYLIRGARQLPGMETPNSMTGWGVLCVRDSIPV